MRTFTAARHEAEERLAALEAAAAETADRARRDATAAEIELLARELVEITASFDSAAETLAACSARAAALIPEGGGLQHFAAVCRAEIPAAGEMIARLLRERGAAVLRGDALAVLPQPAAAFVERVPAKPAPVTVGVFTMRTSKWRDADGVQRYAGQWVDVYVPPETAERALKIGACVRFDDPATSRVAPRAGRRRHPNGAPISMPSPPPTTFNGMPWCIRRSSRR